MAHFLFIDGAYFREAFEKLIAGLVSPIGEIDYRQVIGNFGGPGRAYYYDAVKRTRSDSETQEQADARIRERDKLHSYLNTLPNWHVREGFVTRGRRGRPAVQKGVDVQLAVDALEHAVARNMGRASLIIGDLDYEPLLFSLNRFGIETHVWYERSSASELLLEAADVRHQMNSQTFYNLLPVSVRENIPAPNFNTGGNRPDYPLLKKGIWNGRLVRYSATNTRDMANIWVEAGPDATREPTITVHLSSVGERGEELVMEQFERTYGGKIENWRDGHLP